MAEHELACIATNDLCAITRGRAGWIGGGWCAQDGGQVAAPAGYGNAAGVYGLDLP
jgi:hypothetical protein